MHRRLGKGASLAHLTRTLFAFVSVCAVLVKLFRNEEVNGTTSIFYRVLQEVVSHVFCVSGFFLNSHRFLGDFRRGLVCKQWVLMSFNEIPQNAVKFY